MSFCEQCGTLLQSEYRICSDCADWEANKPEEADMEILSGGRQEKKSSVEDALPTVAASGTATPAQKSLDELEQEYARHPEYVTGENMTQDEWNKAEKTFMNNLDDKFKKLGNQSGGSTSAQTPTPVGRAGSLSEPAQAGSPNNFMSEIVAKYGWSPDDVEATLVGRPFAASTLASKHNSDLILACEEAAESREKVFNEAWMRVMLEKENRIQQFREQLKVWRATLDEIAITGADTLDGYEAANIAAAALARFNDGTSK